MYWVKAQGAKRRASSASVGSVVSDAVAREGEKGPLSSQLLPTRESSVRKTPRGLIGLLADKLFLTCLLLCLPAGFWAQWTRQTDSVIFILNFLGIIPLAWLIGKCTEDLAAVTGEVMGGLLNATFGNVVEMLLCIASIRSGQLTITKCTLLGSILSNLLLVMGCSCLFGGIFGCPPGKRTQTFTAAGANVQVVMLLLSVLCLGMPTAYADTMEDVDEDFSKEVLCMSRYLSVLLLLAYVLFLYFQIVSHPDLFGETGDDEDSDPADMGPWCAAMVLAACTVICTASTDYLIAAIQGTIDAWGLNKEFVGIILLPIIGNAAEHYTAVTVALVDKMDLALGVAVGSSCQMALLVSPLTVLAGWVCGQDMSLDFHSFQLFVLLGAVLVVASVLWSRLTHWLYGAMMIIAYLAVAVVYYTESREVSVFHDRVSEGKPLHRL